MTAEEAITEIRQIIDSPSDADQATDWYSKLTAVRTVIQQYQGEL